MYLSCDRNGVATSAKGHAHQLRQAHIIRNKIRC